LPKSIEIRCPALDSRLKLDLPNFDTLILSDYGLFDRGTVVKLCEKSLRSLREWDWLIQQRMDEGLSMELAWRMGANLDWVWQLHDLHGQPRDWAVLCGLALNQVGSNAYTHSFLSRPHGRYREGSLRTWRFASESIAKTNCT